MHITIWPQKPHFYIANNYVMDDSLQKIVAATHPFFHAFYYVMGVLLEKMPDVERIYVCIVCPDLSVGKLGIITVTFYSSTVGS